MLIATSLEAFATPLHFAAVPKTACTSLKHFFYTLHTGEIFDPAVQGMFIHAKYPSELYEDHPKGNPMRVAVVRDPLERLVSAYRNRVKHFEELSEERFGDKLRAAGLKPDPTLGEFVERLAEYQQVSGPIMHHTRPAVDFLGREPAYYHMLSNMHSLQTFTSAFNRAFGKDVPLRNLQKGGPKLSSADLSDRHRAIVERFYEEDYDVYGSFLSKAPTVPT